MYILLNITITHFSEGVKAFDSDLNSAAWRADSFCHRFCQWREMILGLLKGRSQPHQAEKGGMTGVKPVQRISASHSLGFEEHVLESSHGQSAASLVSYCPSRSLELEEKVITKPSDRRNMLYVCVDKFTPNGLIPLKLITNECARLTSIIIATLCKGRQYLNRKPIVALWTYLPRGFAKYASGKALLGERDDVMI